MVRPNGTNTISATSFVITMLHTKGKNTSANSIVRVLLILFSRSPAMLTKKLAS